MKKIALLASICMFALLMGGCVKEQNEIYARHGFIFSDPDLDNYFRGLIWYTPQKGAAEFDDSVFNEIEVHNLGILARLDNYVCILPLYE